MLGIQGCLLTIMFSASLESITLIDFGAVAIIGVVVLLNVMACRVVRLLRLGAIDTTYTTTQSSTIQFHRMNNLATSSSGTTTVVEGGTIQATSEVSTRKLTIVIFVSFFQLIRKCRPRYITSALSTLQT